MTTKKRKKATPKKSKLNKIQKFIKDNGLDFTGSGSGLNGTCVILAGYALHLNGDTNDFQGLLDDIEENGLIELNPYAEDELERVFDYAYENDYCTYWEEDEAKTLYKL